MKKLLMACVCLCLAATTISASGQEAQVVATARKALQTYDKAIITLSAVIKFEAKAGGGSDREVKIQCVGTIIDPCGLAVTSLTNVNPQMAARRSVRQQVSCQVKEVKYRLADGTEVPARLLLKDEDLDLAFLAPIKPLDTETRAKIAAISLADAAPQPEPLAPIICICRAGEDLDYVPILSTGHVVALLSKPRTCYITDDGILGTPAFDGEGKLLGIVCRCVQNESEENVLRIQNVQTRLILPAADVARLVPQAKEEMKKAAENDKKAAAKKKTEKKSNGKKPVEKKAEKPAEKPAEKTEASTK